MFLHDYLLACEISTVMTITLKVTLIIGIYIIRRLYDFMIFQATQKYQIHFVYK